MRLLVSIPGGYRDRDTESIPNKMSSHIANEITFAGMKSLADKVKNRRKELGWSQTELARMVPCAQSVIGAIESGNRLNPNLIVEIAGALGISVNWLKGLTDDPTPEKADVRPQDPIAPDHIALLQEFRLLEQSDPDAAKHLRAHIRSVADLVRKVRQKDD